MKFSRKSLLKALEPLKPAVGSRSAIPALAHVWFDGKFAYAFDGGMGVRVALETPFSLGVLGTLLFGLLGQTGPDEIDIADGDDGSLVFKAGRSKLKLATMNAGGQVWSYLDDEKPIAALKLSKPVLDALKRVLVVKPSAPKRMEHYGVSVFPLDGAVEFYTTDSKTMAYTSVKEELTGEITSTIIPRGFAEQLISQAKDDAELVLTPKCFRVKATDRVTIYSNVFDTSGIEDLPGTLVRFADQERYKPFELPKGLTDTLEQAILLAGTEAPAIGFRTKGQTLFLRGRFKAGHHLDDDFELATPADERSVVLLASSFLGLKNIDRMSLTETAGVMFGKDGFIYLAASYTAGDE